MGADSLRRALFEFGRSAQLRDPERRALRIIRATESYDVPWAERKLLEANLTTAIRSDAEKRGMTEESLRARLASGAEPKASATLIAESLKNMAIREKSGEALLEAKLKISALEEKVQQLEESLKSAKSVKKSGSS